jgi:hypothetical protein
MRGNRMKIGVIDTETTWGDEVMSIGVAIADANAFELVDKRYYVLFPYKNFGGMYAHALYVGEAKPNLECSRELAMKELKAFLAMHGVSKMFAYNAKFDQRHLPELSCLDWHDIMKLAAYRQHNKKIPNWAECWSTGRLKRDYGVESIYRMLSEDKRYTELHNALKDAIDELAIMRMLKHEIGKYERIS